MRFGYRRFRFITEGQHSFVCRPERVTEHVSRVNPLWVLNQGSVLRSVLSDASVPNALVVVRAVLDRLPQLVADLHDALIAPVEIKGERFESDSVEAFLDDLESCLLLGDEQN